MQAGVREVSRLRTLYLQTGICILTDSDICFNAWGPLE